MTRILLVLALSVLTGWAQEPSQEPAPAPVPEPQQQPAPSPQPTPQAPPQSFPQPSYPDRMGDLERQRIEAAARRDEERRRRQFDEWLRSDDASTTQAPKFDRAHIAVRMHHDAEFDLSSIPVPEWLDGKETTEISWDVQVRDPALRMDQRLAVAYTATVRAKDLNRLGATHELILISGMSAPDGEWLAAPKVVRQIVNKELPSSMELRFSDWVFVRPGEYVLWMVLYDLENARHSTVKRRIRVSEIGDDPLPNIGGRLPMVAFQRSDPADLEFLPNLFMPVLNQRPLAVELISTLSPPEQWSGRENMIRAHHNNTLDVLTTLSQIDLTDGSISLAGLDLTRQEVVYEQQDFADLNWVDLAEAFMRADSDLISAGALKARKDNGAFFRKILTEKLVPSLPENPLRVVIVVSSALLFERGSDLEPLRLEGDCQCRVYHLRLRNAVTDVFDDLQKLIKPLRPRTFDLTTGRDLRKAIAEIIEELERL